MQPRALYVKVMVFPMEKPGHDQVSCKTDGCDYKHESGLYGWRGNKPLIRLNEYKQGHADKDNTVNGCSQDPHPVVSISCRSSRWSVGHDGCYKTQGKCQCICKYMSRVTQKGQRVA